MELLSCFGIEDRLNLWNIVYFTNETMQMEKPNQSKNEFSNHDFKINNNTYILKNKIVSCNRKQMNKTKQNQRTNGPVNAHLISWPSKAQNIHNLENIR